MSIFQDGVAPIIVANGTNVSNPAYLSSGQYVIDLYGWRDFIYAALPVLFGMILIFRLLQALALKHLNNPDK